MIKRRFYKADRGCKDEESDSSSFHSDSDSSSEEDGGSGDEEQREHEDEDEGLLTNDDEDDAGNDGQGLKNLQSATKGNLEGTRKKKPKDIPKTNGSVEPEVDKYVLAWKSVFKCRLCPRIVCLNEDSLTSHLKSKKHARSEKLLGEGRLKLMLNSDGEIEEEAETHAERHARTVALTQKTATPKKNKGRQRQRKRRREKNLAGKKSKSDPPTIPPANKKRKTKD